MLSEPALFFPTRNRKTDGLRYTPQGTSCAGLWLQPARPHIMMSCLTLPTSPKSTINCKMLLRTRGHIGTTLQPLQEPSPGKRRDELQTPNECQSRPPAMCLSIRTNQLSCKIKLVIFVEELNIQLQHKRQPTVWRSHFH